MTIAEQIAVDQREALEAVRKVAESLPGFQENHVVMCDKLGAELPRASTREQPLTSPLFVPGGNASA